MDGIQKLTKACLITLFLVFLVSNLIKDNLSLKLNLKRRMGKMIKARLDKKSPLPDSERSSKRHSPQHQSALIAPLF
jgi:hypothetical protein